MPSHDLRVQLLLTGSEIMSGDTVDSNSAMIAQRLNELALGVYRKVTVGDDVELLVSELEQMTANSDLVIVNGGLGPTVDDLTAEVLARVSHRPLAMHPEAEQHLQQWCSKRNLQLNAANMKQALLPQGCDIIPNATGSAVGFAVQVGQCRVLCTPGVPSELAKMLDDIIEQLAQQQQSTARRSILRLQTFGLGESSAQQIIADNIAQWPAEVELGFRAGAPQMEIKLTIDSDEYLDSQAHCRDELYRLFGDHIIGEGDTLLAARVLELLQERGATITTAESCTGGLIASMLTKIPGSSAAFHAGFVTYANDIKQRILGVEGSTLAEQGAVSEAVVIAMAEGALEKASADYAVAVSGIAGPDGGSADKPVGTVWLAWGSKDKLRTRCLHWPVERSLFQTMVAAAALDMIRRDLLGIESEPRYFKQRAVTQKVS